MSFQMLNDLFLLQGCPAKAGFITGLKRHRSAAEVQRKAGTSAGTCTSAHSPALKNQVGQAQFPTTNPQRPHFFPISNIIYTFLYK